jgi:hypothetical protein
MLEVARMTLININGRKIRTHNEFPPIPDRRFDWSAVDDNAYDGEGSPIGHGATEQEAIRDLIAQLEDCE